MGRTDPIVAFFPTRRKEAGKGDLEKGLIRIKLLFAACGTLSHIFLDSFLQEMGFLALHLRKRSEYRAFYYQLIRLVSITIKKVFQMTVPDKIHIQNYQSAF